MKKLFLIFSLIFILASSVSCDIAPPQSQDPPSGAPPSDITVPPEQKPEEDFIRISGGERAVLIIPEGKDEAASGFSNLISAVTENTSTEYDSAPISEHEIALGRCERELSHSTYEYMESRGEKKIYSARAAICFGGGCAAVAYDEFPEHPEYEEYILSELLEIFSKRYVSSYGIYASSSERYYTEIDLTELQAEIDAEKKEAAFLKFESEAGAEAAAALRRMYDTIYSGDLALWLGSLYSPEHGGFYYSPSARDIGQTLIDGICYDLLPDIESTEQALEFITRSGMISHIGTVHDALPDEMKEKIISFVKARQDKNGYFYHPQWTKEMVDAKLSRRGRDLTKALSILDYLGARPTYDTPTGVKGDGLLSDATPAPASKMTYPLRTPTVVSVSKLTSTAGVYPSHLENRESFESYLSGLEEKMAKDSYSVGGELSAQANQIKARDAALLKEGADYSLVEILHNWLDSLCFETTGHWSSKANYEGLNGLMTISAVYQTLGLPLPYPEAAARSAVDTIDMTHKYPTVCFAFNSWMTVCNIINNVKKHKSENEAERIIDGIRGELRERAPELIAATMKKQGSFLSGDGGFMYMTTGSSGTSQGLPVSVKGMLEGNMNATLLATTGTLYHMFAALDYPSVPLLYEADYYKFISTAEKTSIERKDK